MLVVVLALLVGGIAWTAVSRGGAEPVAKSSAGPSPTASEAAQPQAVVLLPVSTPQDDFTPPMGKDVELVPWPRRAPLASPTCEATRWACTAAPSTCPPATAPSLRTTSSPIRTRRPPGRRSGRSPWATSVHLSRLTPLVLRTDTVVTNHGYIDGAGDAFTSVLQAGTAVLVDDYGVPAVRCYCGNPLAAAPDLGPAPPSPARTGRTGSPSGPCESGRVTR